MSTTDRAERIATLDILRGFALFGMILVHFHQAFRLTTPGIDLWPGEPLSEYVIWWGIEEKAAAVFAFLFGVGFAIILRRAEATGRPFLGYYLRRLLFLALIGVAIEAFTGYVILIPLAIYGLWLLLFHKFSVRTLLTLAVVTAVAGPLFRLGLGLHEVLTGAVPPAPTAPATEAATYWQEVAQRLDGVWTKYRPGWNYLLPSSTITLYLLGMVAVRVGVFDAPRRHVRLVVGAMLFGLACWLVFWLVLPGIPQNLWNWNRNAWPIRYGMGIVANEWLAFTYIGAIVLLVAFRPRWSGRLAAFVSAGRLGLTNYVAQASIIYYLSSDFGLALHLRPYARILGAVVLFSLLSLLSYAWIARFRYGPLEWIWRAFSRMSAPSLRHGSADPPDAPNPPVPLVTASSAT